MPGVAIVLFTRDLRVHDNPALRAAARSSDAVVPLFVLDDELLARFGAPNRVAFLLEALADLDASLRKRGAMLVVRRGDTVGETLKAAREGGADRVFVQADASAWAQRREQRLRAEIHLEVEEGVAVIAPGELTPAGGDHYRVFTPTASSRPTTVAGRPSLAGACLPHRAG
jgi:deoxyribodipyrimidine photo-lyase